DRSEILANKPDSGTVEWNGNTLTLTYTGNAETAYFNLPDWNPNVQEVVMDVPYGTYVVINCGDTTIDITSVNTVHTNYAGKYIDAENTYHNNDLDSSYILYNFPKAETIEIASRFNGTILAPDAYVTSKATKGGNPHLSGALIARGAEGPMEMGYRPFLGPISLLGLSSDYTISVSKFAEDGTTFLKDAKFGLFEVKDGTVTSTLSNIFTSSGNVDIVGVEPGAYALKEISAPDGYVVSDKIYYITVEETGKHDADESIEDDISYVSEVTITVKDALDDTTPTVYKYSPLDAANNTYEINGTEYHFSSITDVDTFELVDKDGNAISNEDKDKIALTSIAVDSNLPTAEVAAENLYLVYYDGEIVDAKVDLCRSFTDAQKLTIANKQGVTFNKTDGNGKLLKGAAIELTNGSLSFSNGTYTYTPGEAVTDWNWNTGTTASTTIDYQSLQTMGWAPGGNYNNVYRIHETATPSDDYELGQDILFYIQNGRGPNASKTLYWTTVANGVVESITAPTSGMGPGMTYNWTSMPLNETDGATRVLTMANYEIGGAKVTFQKTDDKGVVIPADKGALFDLYADGNETAIATDISVGTADLGAAVTDENYVHRGYLKPGIYYLKETQAPDGYKSDLVDQGTLMYFQVKSDFSVVAGKPQFTELSVPSPTGTQVWAKASAPIYNPTKIEIAVSSPESGNLVLHENGFNGDQKAAIVDGVATFESSLPSEISTFKIQNEAYAEMTVTAVRVYAEPVAQHEVQYVLNYEDGTSSEPQTLRGVGDEYGGLKVQDGSFSVDTSNVKSVTFTPQGETTATYFEVCADEWSDVNKAVSDSLTGSIDHSITVTLPSTSTKLMQIYVGGLNTPIDSDSTSDESAITVDGSTISVGNTPKETTEQSVIHISKQAVDKTGELENAKLTLTLDEAAENDATLTNVEVSGGGTDVTKSATKISWTSGKDETTLTGLPDGTYTLTEDTAPAGYVKITTFEFTIKNGVVETSETNTDVAVSDDKKTITATDQLTKVSISKQDDTSKNELAGAFIIIEESAGKEDIFTNVSLSREGTTFEKVEAGFAKDGDGNITGISGIEEATEEDYNKYVNDGNKIGFYSDGKNPTVLNGILTGEYKVKEIIAPDGYQLKKDPILFTIDANGVAEPKAVTIG
ncbi:MAG: SpaA isopeptide-forming pilin-related protein, partial [Oscillospiraceae bacterium]|nr:SpaA isopeptide-forming pilin-related protein [Oscillospiraceae bacterium]